jgi:hypothetical protein
VVVKETENSRLLNKAVKTGERQRLKGGAWWQIITPEMACIFGFFGAISSLQPSTPRWVEGACIESVVRFVWSLH